MLISVKRRREKAVLFGNSTVIARYVKPHVGGKHSLHFWIRVLGWDAEQNNKKHKNVIAEKKKINKDPISGLQLTHKRWRTLIQNTNPFKIPMMMMIEQFLSWWFIPKQTTHCIVYIPQRSSCQIQISASAGWFGNSRLATEPLQTWSCISSSVALQYFYRSSWMVFDLRHERSLLSMWRRWPFCQPLSRPAAACITLIRPGSWLTFWPR